MTDRIADSFWGNIFKGKGDESSGIDDLLKKTPIFQGLNKRELSKIEKMLHQRLFDKGERVFYQGDAGVGLYIIIDGKINIVYEPTGQVIAGLASGEIFGEIALINESPRSASAYADEKSKMMFFSQTDLNNLLEREPALGAKILMQLSRIIGERLMSSNVQIQEFREEISGFKKEAENLTTEIGK